AAAAAEVAHARRTVGAATAPVSRTAHYAREQLSAVNPFEGTTAPSDRTLPQKTDAVLGGHADHTDAPAGSQGRAAERDASGKPSFRVSEGTGGRGGVSMSEHGDRVSMYRDRSGHERLRFSEGSNMTLGDFQKRISTHIGRRLS